MTTHHPPLVLCHLLLSDRLPLITSRPPRTAGTTCSADRPSHFSYAASFFTPVRLVGVVGDDWPEEHTELLTGRGHRHRGPAGRGRAARRFAGRGRYHDNMNDRDTLDVQLERVRRVRPGAARGLSPASTCSWPTASPAVQMKVLDQCPAPTLAVADTMDLWINTARDELLAAAQATRRPGAQRQRGQAADRRREPGRAPATRCCEMGPKFVVIKKGEHGAMFFSEHETYVLPAYPDARRGRSDRRGRQLRRRHDGLPGRAGQLRSRYAQRRRWPTASSWPASTSRVSASTGSPRSPAPTSTRGWKSTARC